MQYLRLANVLEDVSAEETIGFKRLMFHGGEAHIKLLSPIDDEVLIEAQLKNSGYVMELFMATDALRRAGAKEISLLAPYIPYSRQDRVMVPGEPLSIKVLAQMLNAQNYKAVYTLDNHSSVATALIDRCGEIDSRPLIMDLCDKQEFKNHVKYWDAVLISPDAGASKKIHAISRTLRREVVQAMKIRDVNTGEITETRVYIDDLKGKDCLILDDICDGGRTFIELAKALKLKNAGKIVLYVSHGIFFWGLSELLEHIDRIFTTNCFREDAQVLGNITILPLRKGHLK